MKSALQWTMQVCGAANTPCALRPDQICDLVLAVQADTAQWAADTFQTNPFNAADKLVCAFAKQALEAIRNP